jgi:hypothetical protein
LKADIYWIIGGVLLVIGIILRQFGVLDFVQGFCMGLSVVLLVYGGINKKRKPSINN